MNSIRIFLVASILATLILFNFIAALRGYQSSMAEADALMDSQLLEVSKLVTKVDISKIDEDFRLENNSVFQIWSDEALISKSADAPMTALTGLAPGFDFINFDGHRWRSYTYFDSLENKWVMVAERVDVRFLLAENVVLQSISPILLGMPIIALLIWIIVSYGLRPLQALSIELKRKQANDLLPIEQDNPRSELKQVIESTNGFISRLSETLEREKRFSADAAHELRTPISALKIQLHNLSDEFDSDNDSFQQLKNGVERMQHLIEQLLALYRANPDQFSANLQEVDLYHVIENVIAKYYQSIESKNQSIELIGEPCFISGDEFAVETLFSNLLSNANKYTQVGGKIQVSIIEEADKICLIVEDNGPGLKGEERLRVFDRFYRSGQGETNAQVPGCGLGLTIVTHIADLHQAEVLLDESSFDSGCRFKVCFNKKALDEQ